MPEFQKNLDQLDQALDGGKKLLIVLHNHPDPDALASSLALSYLAQERYHIDASIAYGGLIGRAENRALVREVKIPLKQIRRIRFSSYDRIAVLDTQPGAGNNSLPSSVDYHLVIDHHPRRRRLKCDNCLIDADVGACATILIELLKTSELPISTNLATALTYAIRSETLELGRETHPRDVEAYYEVYSKASMRKLARISYPKLPHNYFETMAKTMFRTTTFRHLICAHLGEVPIPELVAETADFLLRHERMSWSFCTGRYNDQLILSLRTSNPKANSGKIIKYLVPDRNFAGGHDMFAGGRIPLEGKKKPEIEKLEKELSEKFAKKLGYENAEWKPLLDTSLPEKD